MVLKNSKELDHPKGPLSLLSHMGEHSVGTLQGRQLETVIHRGNSAFKAQPHQLWARASESVSCCALSCLPSSVN